MSLAITNNSISATPNAKSSDKTTLVDSADNAEEQGFFEKLKSAISSGNTEENQKVEGKKSGEKITSSSTGVLLEDGAEVSDEVGKAAETTKSSQATPATVKSQANDEDVEGTEEKGVKKMAAGGAIAVGDETLSSDSQGSSVEAKKTVSDSAELLNRLDESNSALKPKSTSVESQDEAKLAGAAILGTTTANARNPQTMNQVDGHAASMSGDGSSIEKQSKNIVAPDGVVSEATAEELAALSASQGNLSQTGSTQNNPTQGSASLSGDNLDGSHKSKAVAAGTAANLASGQEVRATTFDGDTKAGTQNQIAWSKPDAEQGGKLDAKTLAATAFTADKLHSSASQSAAMATPATQATAVPIHSATQAGSEGAMAASVLAANAAATNHNTNNPSLTSGNASLAGVQKQKGAANLGQANDAPAGITHAAAAGVTANQLRAEQSQAPTNVQSPLVLTKENASDQVAERVQMMMAKNLKHVDIRLDPPDLGRMQIRMSLNNDSATVHFTVQNQQTRDMVDHAMPRLREMLSQQGIQLADSSVQQQSQGQQQRHASHESSGSGSQSSGQSNHGVDDTEESVSLNVNVANKKDGISYYA
ncbi:flagellar hook-length control protein FliK [Vibrio sp. La 4.2.2]|uniref:flagellar hook-length control protein FliK n=1 Tax=Vibrio sp. La 4.2.2 TaxID=2998830 RepID=UPI0022CDFD04|nr:flagellar hook-length control protein FliK [Vibrio sp. La 4.2.2]MDA0108890.1 flagellar hook-length control protein FliK [Vibrio sp. La 4.2.2]